MSTAYRVINTAQQVMGPFGIQYLHNTAKPFGVIKNEGKKEYCIGRFSTEKKAQSYVKMRLYALKEKVAA